MDFNLDATIAERLLAEAPGLTVLAMSPSDDQVYVANPEYAPELLDLQSWGLKVINPAKPDPGIAYPPYKGWKQTILRRVM